MNTANVTSFTARSIHPSTKLGFWLVWILAHALGGGLGMLMGEMVVHSKWFGSASLFAGFVLFEGFLALVKHTVFRFFKEMKYVQGSDNFTWILAGLAMLFGMATGEGGENEGITVISLNLLRMYMFLVQGSMLSSQVPHFLNPAANQKRKLWFANARQYTDERPIFKPLALLLLGVVVVLLWGIFCVLIVIYFILALGPLEYIKTILQEAPVGAMRVFLFGFAAVGWVGFLSGLCYVLSLPEGLELLPSMFKAKRP